MGSSLEKKVVDGGSYRQPGVGGVGGYVATGVAGLEREKERGKGESLVGEEEAGCTEAPVTKLVALGRFWTRASGGGW